jgi:hypothetical protein
MVFSPESFAEAFSGAPRPAPDMIVSHQCCECERLRDDFAKYTAADMPDEVIDYHSDSITLLTPMAFRYYLPRYVRLTCENAETNAIDFLLFNLCPDNPDSAFWSGRCDGFTRTECEAVISYLEYRRTWPDAEFDLELIEPGVAFWKGLARAR